MERKKLMIFVDWFEPGYKAGGPIQSCKNLSEVLYNDLEIFLVCSDRDLGDDMPYPDIKLNFWNHYEHKIQVFYCTPKFINLKFIRGLIGQLKPDFVYVNGMFSFNYSILPVVAGKLEKVKTIVAPRGMLQAGALQFKKGKKKIFLTLMQLAGLYKNVFFHATDDQELKDIKLIFAHNKGILVLENFPRLEQIPNHFSSKNAGNLKIIFLSRISPKKNVDFILRALEKIRPSYQVFLTIAGEIDDPSYWEKCLILIENLPPNIKVEYRGSVPNKTLSTFYKDYHLFVLPSFGENFGHAILEAMLCSKPVLISDKTPWKDIEKHKAGFAHSLANMDSFIFTMEKFTLMQQVEYNEWAFGAYNYASAIQRNQQDLKKKYLTLFS